MERDAKLYIPDDNISKANPMVMELKKRVNSYYHLTVKNIR